MSLSLRGQIPISLGFLSFLLYQLLEAQQQGHLLPTVLCSLAPHPVCALPGLQTFLPAQTGLEPAVRSPFKAYTKGGIDAAQVDWSRRIGCTGGLGSLLQEGWSVIGWRPAPCAA